RASQRFQVTLGDEPGSDSREVAVLAQPALPRRARDSVQGEPPLGSPVDEDALISGLDELELVRHLALSAVQWMSGGIQGARALHNQSIVRGPAVGGELHRCAVELFSYRLRHRGSPPRRGFYNDRRSLAGTGNGPAADKHHHRPREPRRFETSRHTRADKF